MQSEMKRMRCRQEKAGQWCPKRKSETRGGEDEAAGIGVPFGLRLPV